VPAGTPAPVVKKLNELITAALQAPKVREYLLKGGTTPFPTSSEELMKFQQSEHGKWKEILTAAKIQPE
jgi:tripartite-type tricarboxylate transporter receptor subunit TctC